MVHSRVAAYYEVLIVLAAGTQGCSCPSQHQGTRQDFLLSFYLLSDRAGVSRARLEGQVSAPAEHCTLFYSAELSRVYCFSLQAQPGLKVSMEMIFPLFAGRTFSPRSFALIMGEESSYNPPFNMMVSWYPGRKNMTFYFIFIFCLLCF